MRTKLPDRRYSSTVKVRWVRYDGKELNIQVTIGFDAEGKAREVFCGDFKAGSDNQAIVMDSCILLSRLLQHGDTPADLKASMCEPPSLIGAIADAIQREETMMAMAGVTGVSVSKLFGIFPPGSENDLRDFFTGKHSEGLIVE